MASPIHVAWNYPNPKKVNNIPHDNNLARTCSSIGLWIALWLPLFGHGGWCWHVFWGRLGVANVLKSHMGTTKIYTTTGFGPRKNREMAGVDDLVMYMQTAVKYTTFYIHHPRALRTPGVVYIESVTFYSSLHIHHQIVHASHFSIFPRPEPGGGVYLWGPNH